MNGISGLELSVSLAQLSALKHFSIRLFMCLQERERREEKKGRKEIRQFISRFALGCSLLSCRSGSQSVVPRATLLALPANLIEMSRLLNLELIRWETSNQF